MKKGFLFVFLMGFIYCSCKESPIPTFDAKNSCAFFDETVQSFSIKGIPGDVIDLDVNINYMGHICDYDRPINVEVVDSSVNTASLNKDFVIKEAVVKAGATSGHVLLGLNKLDSDVSALNAVLRILPNEHFPQQRAKLHSSNIIWSADYSRPRIETVWKSWYYFFTPSYSKDYHKLLVDYFGTDIEKCSYESKALKDSTLTYKTQNWWYSASRDFYQMVKEHDQKNPDNPYRHSDDFENYSYYNIPVGEGKADDSNPTILSTLLIH